jgi:outer membrane lipoprotein carrier protein
MKLRKLIHIMFLTTIGFNCISAQTMQEHDERSKQILQLISDETEKNYTTKIDFNLSIKGEDINDTQKGFAYLKGESFYYKTEDREVICNGSSLWTHVIEDEECYVDNLEDIDNAINPNEIFTIWKKGFNYKYVNAEIIDNNNIHTIKMFPSNPNESKYHTVILKVNETKKQIKSATIKTKNAVIIQFEINSLEPNPVVKENLFVWSENKYPNVDMIDNR